MSNNRVYFVWNHACDDHDNKFRLNHVEYDIEKKTHSNTILPYPSTWNILIALSNTDKLLCLAYHGVSMEIAVEFISIEPKRDKTQNGG